MCKIKYYLLFVKNCPHFFCGLCRIFMFLEEFKIKFIVNSNKTKKDLNPEIKKDFKKTTFDVLTNENDFLVKNLKKAG